MALYEHLQSQHHLVYALEFQDPDRRNSLTNYPLMFYESSAFQMRFLKTNLQKHHEEPLRSLKHKLGVRR